MSNVHVFTAEDYLTQRLSSYTHYDEEGNEVIEAPPIHPLARELRECAELLTSISERFQRIATAFELPHA